MEQQHQEKYKLPDLPALEKDAFINIECPSCQENVSAEHLNIQDKIGKCGSCNVVFSFAKSIQSNLLLPATSEELARPEGVDLIEFGDEMELTVEQPPSMLDILIVSMVPFFALLFTLLFFIRGKTWALMPGIVAALISATSTFRLMNRKGNKIFITINNENLYIQWRPKNFMQDKVYSVKDVEQLYVNKSTDGISVNMIVNGINGQKHEQILGRFSSLIKAKYIEQEIERYLGLENRKVPGEM